MYKVTEFLKAHARRIYKRSEVETVRVSAGLAAARVVVAINLRNERDAIDFFLAYYRQMGATEFIVLDNNSSDGIEEALSSQAGISLFRTRHDYSRSRYGIDWMNGIFNRHCTDKWILYVDADEFLVYPQQDEWTLSDLVDHLDRTGRPAMSCVMLDMYSRNRISQNVCRPGQNPLEVCPLFDRSGYKKSFDVRSNVEWIKGGVRGREYFKDDLIAGPALNKIPLIRWKPRYAFVKSTHELVPSALNLTYTDRETVSGALMHAKFISKFMNLVNDADLVSAHTSEYRNYVNDQKDQSFFQEGLSKTFTGWRSLAEEGLIQVPGGIAPEAVQRRRVG